MAFRVSTSAGAWKNDLTTSSTSARTALSASLRVIRFNAFDEDVYIQFGDNTIVAVLGEGLRIPAGQTELCEPPVSATNFAYITANAAKLNVCYGENE